MGRAAKITGDGSREGTVSLAVFSDPTLDQFLRSMQAVQTMRDVPFFFRLPGPTDRLLEDSYCVLVSALPTPVFRPDAAGEFLP